MLRSLVISIVIGGAIANSIESNRPRVKLQVFTTSGCSDTARFIVHQLEPTYRRYKDNLEVEFVPWGRSSARNSCQFGAKDCYANKVQRCTLNALKGSTEKQVLYMLCEFSSNSRTYYSGATSCSEAAGVARNTVEHCLDSGLEATLAEDAKRMTRKPMDVIDFVPALVFNESIDTSLMRDSLRDLSGSVCKVIRSTSYSFRCL